MELKLKKTSEIYVLELFGELDLYNSYKVKELFSKMVERGISSIVFDLDQTDYIDSTGIGVFIYCFDVARRKNVNMCLCNVKGTVAKVINLTKLNNYFNITKDVNSGIEFVK